MQDTCVAHVNVDEAASSKSKHTKVEIENDARGSQFKCCSADWAPRTHESWILRKGTDSPRRERKGVEKRKFLVTRPVDKSQGSPAVNNFEQTKFVDLVCQVLPRRCHDTTRVHLVRAPVRGGGLSAPFGGWSRGPARAASARTEDAEPGPGRLDAGPTSSPPLPQGGRAGAAPFAPSHRPGQLLGGAPPAVADAGGACVSACGELPSTAFRGSAVFPTLSPPRPAAPRRARGRVFRRSAATHACAELGERLRRRRDGVRRRVGGCEVPFL